MMSDKALDALIRFTEETDEIIVTRGLPDPDLRDLEQLLAEWEENPNQATRNAIIREFADDGLEDLDL